MKKILSHHRLHILLVILFCTLVFLFVFWPEQGQAQLGIVTLSDQTKITVEIAQTPESREQGLSGRETIGEGIDGMALVFDEPQVISIWMKDMQFPLDLLWIKNGVIMDMEEQVPAPSSNVFPRYTFEESVDMVLEIPAGFVKEHGIDVGQEVDVVLP